jgi:hypothetical protein
MILAFKLKRKNNKYRAIFITKPTKLDKTQDSSWKAANRPAFLRPPGWVGRTNQIKFYAFC